MAGTQQNSNPCGKRAYRRDLNLHASRTTTDGELPQVLVRSLTPGLFHSATLLQKEEAERHQGLEAEEEEEEGHLHPFSVVG